MIDKNDIDDLNKLPAGAKPAQFWTKGLFLEKAILKNSGKLVSDIEKAVNEANDDATEALKTRLKAHVDLFCNKTYNESK